MEIKFHGCPPEIKTQTQDKYPLVKKAFVCVNATIMPPDEIFLLSTTYLKAIDRYRFTPVLNLYLQKFLFNQKPTPETRAELYEKLNESHFFSDSILTDEESSSLVHSMQPRKCLVYKNDPDSTFLALVALNKLVLYYKSKHTQNINEHTYKGEKSRGVYLRMQKRKQNETRVFGSDEVNESIFRKLQEEINRIDIDGDQDFGEFLEFAKNKYNKITVKDFEFRPLELLVILKMIRAIRDLVHNPKNKDFTVNAKKPASYWKLYAENFTSSMVQLEPIKNLTLAGYKSWYENLFQTLDIDMLIDEIESTLKDKKPLIPERTTLTGDATNSIQIFDVRGWRNQVEMKGDSKHTLSAPTA